MGKRKGRAVGETQVSLRLPTDCLTRADAVAEWLQRDPAMTGLPVNRAFVLRKAVISGLIDLEREMNIVTIHWRNADPPDRGSDFDAVLQDFVRIVEIALPGLTADGWARGVGSALEIHIHVPPATWVPRSNPRAAAGQQATARIAQRLYGEHVLVVKTPRDLADQLAAWWQAAQRPDSAAARSRPVGLATPRPHAKSPRPGL